MARIFSAFAKIADDWLRCQNLFCVACTFDSTQALRQFYEQFLDSPFRGIGGGSRFNNLAWLYLIAKAMQPDLVIDSGTFRGASAWAFAAAGAKVQSFDIDLSRLARRENGVVYSECDWTQFEWKDVDFSRSLIYFDDHLDQVRRLIEAARLGIPLAIFADVSSHVLRTVARGGAALPKIEFVLDDWAQERRHPARPRPPSTLSHRYSYLDRAALMRYGCLPDIR